MELLEMKYTIPEAKNNMDRMNSRLDTSEEKKTVNLET